jgi:hypothetical protein
MSKSKYITVNGVKLNKTKIRNIMIYAYYLPDNTKTLYLLIIYKNGETYQLEFNTNKELQHIYKSLTKALKEYEND